MFVCSWQSGRQLIVFHLKICRQYVLQYCCPAVWTVHCYRCAAGALNAAMFVGHSYWRICIYLLKMCISEKLLFLLVKISTNQSKSISTIDTDDE